MPAAAEPVYMEMTLEDYLMEYCEEHVRARASECVSLRALRVSARNDDRRCATCRSPRLSRRPSPTQQNSGARHHAMRLLWSSCTASRKLG